MTLEIKRTRGSVTIRIQIGDVTITLEVPS